MVRPAFLSAFKGHVFPKVGQAQLVGCFVAATNVEHDATMSNLGMQNLFMDNSDAVGQRMQFVVFHSTHNPKQRVKISG